PSPSLRPTPAPDPFGTVPPGWNIYRGTRLPVIMAYPPGWTVDESVPTELLFASEQENAKFTITYGGPKQVTLGELRDARFNDIANVCHGTRIEYTDEYDFSGLIFAGVRAKCDLTANTGQARSYTYFIGTALKDGREWDFRIVCARDDFS